MSRSHLPWVVVASLLLGGAAVAHHAFSPVYDGGRTISAEGVVSEFRLVNPHGMMTLDVTNEEGNVVTWTVEFPGRLHLTVNGWTDDTLKAGERITVFGNPTHTGSSSMAFRRIVKADGTELLSARAEGVDAVEELRRQRARARRQDQ